MRELEGAPRVISGHNGQFTLVTETIDHFKTHNYDLSNDVDGDTTPEIENFLRLTYLTPL